MLSHLNYSLVNNYRFLNNPKDKVVGVVLQTKDYGQFHMDKLNRELNTSHAKKLLEKIKENKKLVLEPILVDKSMKIIDGQHRFWALSQLGLPITYMIDDQISIIDAPELNSSQRNWTSMDYIKVFANKGNTNYQHLLEELEKYKTVSTIGIIAQVFSKRSENFNAYGAMDRRIKKGKYEFDQSNQSKNAGFFDFISTLHYKMSLDHRIPVNVQEAVGYWYFNSRVDKNRLEKIIDKELVDNLPRNNNLCARAIGDKYNNRLRPENRINYYVDNKGNFNFIKED